MNNIKKIKNYENIIITRFNNKFKKFGKDIRSLGWDNNINQKIRFQNILKISNINHFNNILDVGCGFGDLYFFIKKNKIKLNYSGIDINKTFIEINKQNKDLKKCKFYNQSIFKFNKKFDVITSFGLLNYKKCTNIYIEKFIKSMFEKTKKAALIDFISEDQKFKKDNFIKYHKPENILKITKKISKNFCLFSNYPEIPQKEFTIIIYK